MYEVPITRRLKRGDVIKIKQPEHLGTSTILPRFHGAVGVVVDVETYRVWVEFFDSNCRNESNEHGWQFSTQELWKRYSWKIVKRRRNRANKTESEAR